MPLLAAACGMGPVGPDATASDPPTSTVTTGPAATGTPFDRYPSEDRYGDPLDRLVYRAAFDDCALFGAERLATGYGGRAEDPSSLARAYAEFADPSRPVPATQGCLDGLAAHAGSH
jgi:hypothetical protein